MTLACVLMKQILFYRIDNFLRSFSVCWSLFRVGMCCGLSCWWTRDVHLLQHGDIGKLDLNLSLAKHSDVGTCHEASDREGSGLTELPLCWMQTTYWHQ